MADGYPYVQPTAGNPTYSGLRPASAVTSEILLNSLLTHISPEPRPSASDPPRSSSPRDIFAGMYGQNHQQGHGNRLNGAPGGQRMPMLYNYQQPAAHQHQGHAQHHQSIQADHPGHAASGSVMGHHSSYSGGVLPSSSPFTAALQNGHVATATRSGQPQQINDHWAEQLRLHKDAERANSVMVEQHQPNFYARLKADQNKVVIDLASATNNQSQGADDELEDRRRPTVIVKSTQRQDWHSLDLTGHGLRALSPRLFEYIFLQELYIASNKLTSLPPAIGELRQLSLLDASCNQISDLPAEIGMCTQLKQLNLFDNNIRTLPFELGSLYLLDMLGIEGNPLDQELKQEIVERGTKSLISWLREQAPIPMPPASRKTVVVQEDVSTSLERVGVLSWNILCDRYATTQIYGYTPSGALSWDYRKESILQEIRSRDADILCLQEVSSDTFRDFLSPELAIDDYKGIHWPRPKAKTMPEKEAGAVDGCAIFYKATKYLLLDKQLVDFASIAINRPDMKSHADIFNRVMPKDNIAVIGFFESRETGARLIVANAHLAWEAYLADVKVIQTAILMEYVTKQAEKYARWPACRLQDKKVIQLSLSVAGEDGQETSKRKELPEPAPSQEYRSNTEIPTLICGDFNSVRDSAPYTLLSQGSLPPDTEDLQPYQYGAFTRDGIEHPFSLRSAYVHLEKTSDELPFTNYTPGFAEVIDYIWYSTNTLEVVELLGPPDKQYLKRVPGFPNYHFPSDHIQTMAELVVKARKDRDRSGPAKPDFGGGSGGGGGPSGGGDRRG